MIKPVFKIKDRLIGEAFPPLVIAEIGINHKGDLDIAKKMVDEAFKSGAEVIKHQTHVIEDEMSNSAKKVIPGNASKSIYHIMEECALNEEDEFELMKYVEDKGMIYLSTPFSRAAADRLDKFGVAAFKIGSGECNNYPLLEHIAKFGKPMILSTGMNTISSVRKAVDILKKHNISYALLHTTNLYPTPFHLVRLGGMTELKKNFPEAVIGLSDHTINNLACFAATALGASILERHFTDTMEREGPDIINSMDPLSLKELIVGSSTIHKMLGGKKEPAKEEKVTIDFAFATVVTIKKVNKGEVFTEKNLWVKRPGTGEILAEDYKVVLGKKAVRDIQSDTHLSYDDFE